MRDEGRGCVAKRAASDIEKQLAAGLSGSRISMGQARECYDAMLDSLDLAWRNFRLCLRAFFFAIFCWITGGCTDPLPPECQFYVNEIERVDDAPQSRENIEYRAHMEAELGYCKRRAELGQRNALDRARELEKDR